MDDAICTVKALCNNLGFYEPSDVLELWEKHNEAMLEDYKRNNQSSFAVEQMVLIDIRKLLESM
jgi:hypothetical protein